jgi:phage terminase large subunit
MAPNAIDAYISAAKAAGCPPDQIAHFIRAGIVLQPRQLEASAAARSCDLAGGPTEIGYGGARGGGKSHWGMAQVGADDCQRFPGLKVLVLRKVGKALREGVTDLLRRIYVGLEYRWAPSEQIVYFPNGSRMLLGHFQHERDIDAYLGLEYDLILIEEATTLSASKRRAILTCLRTSKPGWRPRCYSTTNPGGVGHGWYRAAIVEPHRRGAGYAPWHQQRGPTRYIPATVDDNRFVNEEYAGQLNTLTGWQLRAWRYGDWDIAAGQYFTNFRREIHVIRPLPALDDTWPIWGGLDYGFTHYTVFYLATKFDGAIYLLDEYAARKQLIPANASGIKALLQRNRLDLGRLDRIVAGTDVFTTRHTGATIAEGYKAEGLVLTPANVDRINGAGELLGRMGDVDAATPIAPRLYICEGCTGLIETIPLLQHDPNRPEDVLKWDTDEDGAGGDDYYDAGRYTVMAGSEPARQAKSTNVPNLWQIKR